MSKVFLIDTKKKPLNPIHPAQARQLLRNKKAAIFRRFPFTLILKEAKSDVEVEPLRLKIDPGAKTTGMSVTRMHFKRLNITQLPLSLFSLTGKFIQGTFAFGILRKRNFPPFPEPALKMGYPSQVTGIPPLTPSEYSRGLQGGI